jgi:ParB-like chromosome segregation protein Spo0J
MNVELRNIATIRPYPGNPRHNDAAVDAVAASIRAFGFRQPIVVDEQGVIIVGHTRYKAALKLGLKEVPVHVAAGLSPAQIKAYRLADNQTTTLSDWDNDPARHRQESQQEGQDALHRRRPAPGGRQGHRHPREGEKVTASASRARSRAAR